MAFDPTRTNPVYQKPQTASQIGTPNTNQAYDVNIAQNNPGVAPTISAIPSGGFGTGPMQPLKAPSAFAPQQAQGGSGGSGGDAPLAGPGYQEDWYKRYGNDLMSTPSASEDLYSRGVNASNPYYDYAQQQATKAINDSAAARGNYNSSYTMNLIGKTAADIRGQQAHELDMLAGQADQGKFGRYDRGNQYSGDAQSDLERRANSAIGGYRGLANDQADKVSGFYGEAGRESTQSQMAAIEAALKKAGLTSAEAKAMMDQATDVASLYTSLYGVGGKKGGGGGGGGGGDFYTGKSEFV